MARACVVGGGSFGSVVCRIVGKSVESQVQPLFDYQVKWWIREEDIVADVNNNRRNTKFLGPDSVIPSSVVASTDLETTVRSSDIVILAVPYEFFKYHPCS